MDEGVSAIAGYRWLEYESFSMRAVVPALVARASGAHVLIARFDGGAPRRTDEERATGWLQAPAGIVSPPLTAGVELPWEQTDEWWVFESAAAAERFPAAYFFVNNHGWSLRSPTDIVASFDPTWERDVYDWLYDYQRRFWDLVDVHRPLAYVANGKRLVVATRSDAIYAAVRSTFAMLQ